MSLLDAFDEPCTRQDTSDYGIDEPIMDGPYGNAADHAPTAANCRHCRRPARDHCPDCSACPDQECPYWCEPQDE